jgi:hypothetical protein
LDARESEDLLEAQDERGAAEGLQKVTTVKLQRKPLDVLGFLPLFKTFKHMARPKKNRTDKTRHGLRGFYGSDG